MFIDNNLSDGYEGKITGKNSQKETFSVSMTNATGVPVKIVLYPGNLRTGRPVIPVDDAGTLKVPILGGTHKEAVAAGTMPFMVYDFALAALRYDNEIDVIMDDGINKTLFAVDSTHKLTIETNNRSVREMVSFINQAPADLEKIRFNVNSRHALDKLTVIELNPFGSNVVKRTIELSDYIDAANQQDGLLDIDLRKVLGQKLQLDENTILVLDFPSQVETPSGIKNADMKITFWFKNIVKQASVASVLKSSGF